MRKTFLQSFFGFLWVTGIILGAGINVAQAGFECGPTSCVQDSDCQQNDVGIFPCPNCFVCDPTQQICVLDSSLCDDGDPCTNDFCEENFDAGNESFGCVHEPLGVDPNVKDLPIECYVCEPTANNVTVNNGVCDRAAGENCTNSPDCEQVGETCIFPNQVAPTPLFCQNINPGVTIPVAFCADGDACTFDFCVRGPNDPEGSCQNPERDCSQLPDGCCPIDCVGPAPGDLCPQSPTETTCDPDCWPSQSCGDGVVQPPETCDASANAGEAGVRPGGQPVLDSECRQPGEQFECTYCGDNIAQTPLEICDGIDDAACGGQGCDINCQCGFTTTNICLEGSGDLLGGEGNGAAPLPAFCDTCALNKKAAPQGFKNYLGYVGIFLILSITWRLRGKVSQGQ